MAGKEEERGVGGKEMDSREGDEYVLYHYFRSTCSERVRIGLNLKGLEYKSHYVNLFKGENKDPEFAKQQESDVPGEFRDTGGGQKASYVCCFGDSAPAEQFGFDGVPFGRKGWPSKGGY
ncbi:Glutathione S-transferase zeta class [Smittium mucronatum]|uniref:Glutathione S-transferase zeta class n=1 Tax=Smittium mucronatum TaxID=133383 RepID=A0A1R0GUD0_9FUNG|nr:Glutathione S-transferase zeta class [Smittium mucronatum]